MLYECWAEGHGISLTERQFEEYGRLSEAEIGVVLEYLEENGLACHYELEIETADRTPDHTDICWDITMEGIKEVESWNLDKIKKDESKILPQFADSTPQSFSHISITITADYRHAIIEWNGIKKTYHYGDLGLENPRGKSEKTRQKETWRDLLAVAANSESAKQGRKQEKIKRERVYRLRKFLIGITGIKNEDPLPYSDKDNRCVSESMTQK